MNQTIITIIGLGIALLFFFIAGNIIDNIFKKIFKENKEQPEGGKT